MINFMLDTNIVAYAMNGNPPSVLQRLLSHEPSEICISSITFAELQYGIRNSSNPDQNQLATMLFLSEISILPFDADAAIAYCDIRYDLKSRRSLIGANDLLIAAHARSQSLTLITHNTREFSRVNGLKLEDWV